MKQSLKSRFCPSPTGLIHLGNARTALFNALAALHAEGVFLLRIEDTDADRSKSEFTQELMADLRWMHCDWQEGADSEGDAGPYWQSQRGDIYDTYYQKLIDAGRAYPCFCSEEQLALARKLQRSKGEPPRYPGTCRHLTDEQRQAKVAEGKEPTLRFEMPRDTAIEFTDLVKGPQIFQSNDIGDFIIRRANGTSSFMFCNAIDDSLMGVTCAIRGEDHLSNSPRQIAILDVLDMPHPNYGHTSLIFGQDGAPLSKRNGSRSITDLREEGYLPMAVVNYLARLGHNYENNDFMDFAQLATEFSEANLSKSPARFDEQQLLHWQKEAVAHADAESIWQWMGEAVHNLVPDDKKSEFIDLVKPNVVFPKEALHWAEILFNDTLNYSDDAKNILTAADAALFASAIKGIAQFDTDFKALVNFVKEDTGIKGKALFQPLRVALTGELHGPEMGPLANILGADGMQKRIESINF